MDQTDGKELAGIIAEIEARRARWREVRDERLQLKRELEARGLDKAAVRKDRGHTRLKKEQDHLTTVIRHIEKKLNRKRANLEKKEKRP